MQQPYRITKLGPAKDETLVSSREQAETILADIDRALKGKLSQHERAVKMQAQATLYNALGDVRFLESAQACYKFSKTAQSAYLVAVALHMMGRIPEALQWYERAYQMPHEAGFKIDVSYASTFLFQGDWPNWHAQVRKLKQRAVYAAYLNEWRGEPVPEISLIGEGGYGDIILHSRWYKAIEDCGVKVTLYLADYFWEAQFMELARAQVWMPTIKRLHDCPAHTPAIGVFDLPALWDTTPSDLLPSIKWTVGGEKVAKFAGFFGEKKPNVGICWSAKSSEAPLVCDGVYRSLTHEQVQRIIDTNPQVNWVNVQWQPDWLPEGICAPKRDGWLDTAGLIKNLDLLVTVDTGTMHLAAALGTPTWVLLSGATDAKFQLTGNTMPWYDNMRLFRNNDFGFDNAVNNLISAITGSEIVRKT